MAMKALMEICGTFGGSASASSATPAAKEQPVPAAELPAGAAKKRKILEESSDDWDWDDDGWDEWGWEEQEEEEEEEEEEQKEKAKKQQQNRNEAGSTGSGSTGSGSTGSQEQAHAWQIPVVPKGAPKRPRGGQNREFFTCKVRLMQEGWSEDEAKAEAKRRFPKNTVPWTPVAPPAPVRVAPAPDAIMRPTAKLLAEKAAVPVAPASDKMPPTTNDTCAWTPNKGYSNNLCMLVCVCYCCC